MSIVTNEIQDSVSSLYIAFFGRAPDAAGFGYWSQEQASGVSPYAQAADFARSVEWTSQYGGLTPTQQVQRFYLNVLNREADAEGLAYWVAEINNGLPFSAVAYNIVWAAFTGGNTVDPADNALVNNKVDVAEYFALTLASNDIAIAQTAFVGVTNDPATVTVAEARLTVAVNTETFTLTTGIDTATATLFDGSLTAAGIQTLNQGDQLTGKGATGNVLDATITSSVTPALLSNIQTVEITSNGVGANTVGLINATGITTLVNDGSAQALTFANVGASATNVTVQNTTAATTVGYTTTTGTQTVNLNLSNVTGPAVVTMAGIEVVNVASNGAANSVDLELSAATTLNFTGAQNLTVAPLASGATVNVSNVNASAMTGNFTVDVGNQTGVLSTTAISVTGGSGNDSLTTGVTQAVSVFGGLGNDTIIDTGLTAADTINGGDGTDTLSSTTATLTGYVAPTVATISNIEAITVSNALAGNITLSNIQAGINTVNLASTFSLDTAGRTVTFDSGVAGTVNLNASMIAAAGTAALTVASAGVGLTDTITIKNNNATGLNVFANVDGQTAQAINATGVETLVINTYFSGVLAAQTIGAIGVTGSTGATAAETVNFVGANTVSTGAITADIVNASGLTAATGTVFTASLVNGANASVTGSAGNDSITSGTGNDVLNGGAGNDTLTAATGNDSLSGGDGTDRLVFATAGNLTVNDTVDGGAGVNTLVATADDITSNAALADAVDLAALGRITNVQAIEVTDIGRAAGTDTVINVARVSSGITTVNTVGVTGNQSSTFTFNSGASTLNLGTGAATAALGAATTLVAAGTGASDSLTIVKNNTSNNDDFASQALTVTGIETISFNTGAATALGAQDIGTIAFTPTTTNAGMNINVLGGDDATLAAVTTTGTGLLTINASGMTAVIDTTFNLTAPVTTGGTVSITGSAGNDVLRGDTNDRNTIEGGAGNDSLVGGSAADSLVGGAGIDTIAGGGGNDTMLGGDGNDAISFTAASADTVSVDGGAGNDTVTITTFTSVAATDIIKGGDGTDTLSIDVVNNIAGAGAGITEFETLTILKDGAASQAITTVFTNDTTLNRVDFEGSTGAKVITAASAALAEVRLLSNTSLAVTRTTDTATNALTISGQLNASVTVATVTANNEETLTLDDGAMAAGRLLIVSALNAIDLSTLNITGVQNTAFTVGTSATATGLGTTARIVTIDASSATGTVNAVASTALATQALVMTGSLAAANTLTGGLGADTITGGNVADILTGGQGADVINGGSGTDTFSAVGMNAALVDGSTGTSVGAVVNLGATTLSAADIFTASGLFTSSGTQSVASNTTAYLSAAATLGLATTVDTLASIENATGSTGTDYIVGSAGANNLQGNDGADTIIGGEGNDTITGGAGADTMTGGAGIDTFVTGFAGDSIVASASTLATTIAATNTLTFGNGVDIITDFAATDLIDVATATTAPTNLIGLANNLDLVTGTTYVMYGDYNDFTSVFTAAVAFNAMTANDALIVVGDAATLTAVSTTGYTLLDNLSVALAAANFV